MMERVQLSWRFVHSNYLSLLRSMAMINNCMSAREAYHLSIKS